MGLFCSGLLSACSLWFLLYSNRIPSTKALGCLASIIITIGQVSVEAIASVLINALCNITEVFNISILYLHCSNEAKSLWN